jgi:hypothetical protein
MLPVIDGIAAFADELELAFQCLNGRDRGPRELAESALLDDPSKLLSRQVRKQDLSEAGAVRRRPLPDRRVHPDRLRRLDLVDVDDIALVKDPEMDRLVGL